MEFLQDRGPMRAPVFSFASPHDLQALLYSLLFPHDMHEVPDGLCRLVSCKSAGSSKGAIFGDCLCALCVPGWHWMKVDELGWRIYFGAVYLFTRTCFRVSFSEFYSLVAGVFPAVSGPGFSRRFPGKSPIAIPCCGFVVCWRPAEIFSFPGDVVLRSSQPMSCPTLLAPTSGIHVQV